MKSSDNARNILSIVFMLFAIFFMVLTLTMQSDYITYATLAVVLATIVAPKRQKENQNEQT